MSAETWQIVLAAVPAILAITLHEAAHGYAALALGDQTAKRMGRLSLNPLRHVDPVGTLLLPAILWLSFGFMFGWAKPVPVWAGAFRDPRRGMALVAAAGPAINFALAWVSALALHGADRLTGAAGPFAYDLLTASIITNLALGLFNLLPVPPLDGGRIAVGLLPARLAAVWMRFERFGLAAVLVCVFLLPRLLAEFGIRFDPVHDLLLAAVERGWSVTLALAGYDAHG